MKIAIASGKGGTGKTSLAVNLAHKASALYPSLLLDLDVEEPNGSIFIPGSASDAKTLYRKIPLWNREACTLCGACVSKCHYNALVQIIDQIVVLPELCHGCYACSELCPAQALPMQDSELGTYSSYRLDELDFVEAKLKIGLQQAPPLIAQSLALVQAQHPHKDIYFLDCPPGTSCPMIGATKSADYVILITEPSRFGIWDLSLAVETMREMGKDFGVVVNRWGTAGEEILDYLSRENIELLATIPDDRLVAELYSEGSLIYNRVPAFDAALEKILAKLRSLPCAK